MHKLVEEILYICKTGKQFTHIKFYDTYHSLLPCCQSCRVSSSKIVDICSIGNDALTETSDVLLMALYHLISTCIYK